MYVVAYPCMFTNTTASAAVLDGNGVLDFRSMGTVIGCYICIPTGHTAEVLVNDCIRIHIRCCSSNFWLQIKSSDWIAPSSVLKLHVATPVVNLLLYQLDK